MGEVIHFPAERITRYVALSQCCDEYLIGVIDWGQLLDSSLEWCEDYAEAIDRWTRMGRLAGLPLVDLRPQVAA